MKMMQFAIPQKLSTICAELAATVAGGATLIPARGWWVDEDGEIQREEIGWLVVGVEDDKIEELTNSVKSVLKSSGERAIFYTIGNEPRLEWL